jgi:proteasome accessory factor B
LQPVSDPAAERLVNLALFLAGSRSPVTAEVCRASGLGYPAGQDQAAFERMFERDKKALRDAGLPIVVDTSGETEAYSVAPEAFAAEVALSAEELAVLGAAGAAMLSDPTFPLAEDLRYALAKVAPSAEVGPPTAAGRLADEDPEAQGETAAALTAAVAARKTVSFGYTTADGRTGERRVEPYGLHLRDGRWYLVARDPARDAIRTFTVARMRDVEVNTARPATPDYERPEDFDVAAHVVLPFQYGPRAVEAVVRFAPSAAWRASRLAAGRGTLTSEADGSVTWHVAVADETRFLRWIVENGPGILPVSPASLRERLAEGLAKVVALHER